MLSFFALSLLVTDYIFCSSSIYRPQRSCGKVMFLHLSVIHSIHKGVCMAGGVRAMHAPFHYTCPQHVCPLPCMCPPTPPSTAPAKHSLCHAFPCHAHPLFHMPPAMHTPCHACPHMPCMPPAMHAPSPPYMSPCHACPCHICPPPSHTPHLPYTHPLPCMPPPSMHTPLIWSMSRQYASYRNASLFTNFLS